MNERFRGLARVARRFSVCCRPLASVREESVSDYRCRELFPAASVVKAAIMSCLLNGVEQGRFSLRDQVEVSAQDMVGGAGILLELSPRAYSVRELCTLMMVVSDNTASNACLRLVGMDRFNAFCEGRGYEARLRRFFMSPVVDGNDNAMTAEAAALILADLYAGQELSEASREFAVGVLRRQQYREKIPLMLPHDVLVGHKTGELDGVRHDAAVVEIEEPYVLVVLTAEGGRPWEVDHAIAEHSLSVFEQKARVMS